MGQYRLKYDPANPSTIEIDNGSASGTFLPYAQRSLLPQWDFSNGSVSLQESHNDFRLVFAQTDYLTIQLSSDGGATFALPGSFAALIAWIKQYLFVGPASTSGGTVSLPTPVTTGGITVTKTLTVASTAVSYNPGMVVGAKMLISGAARIASGTGTIASVYITNKDNAGAIDILLFNADPTSGTYTNHVAYTFASSDEDNLVARISIAASDYSTTGTYKVNKALGLGFQAGASGNLWAIVVATGAATYGANSLTVKLSFYQD